MISINCHQGETKDIAEWETGDRNPGFPDLYLCYAKSFNIRLVYMNEHAGKMSLEVNLSQSHDQSNLFWNSPCWFQKPFAVN